MKTPKSFRAISAIIPVLIAWLLLPFASPAVTKFWNGSANGNLSNAGNWVGGVAPVAGDDLVFQVNSLVTRIVVTNDFSPNRAWGSITIQGTNYFLRGNALQLTNGITTINAVGANTIDADVEVRASQFWEATGALAVLDVNGNINLNTNTLTIRANTGDFFLSGLVSGTGNLVKTNVGTLRLDGSGSNTYSGFTRFDGGVLELNKTGGVAIPGDLTIGDGNGLVGTDVFRLLRDDQIADAADITVKNSGAFNLNGFSDRIGALTMQGGTIDTGGGTLFLGGNLTTLSDANSAVIGGRLSLGGASRTFTVNSGPPAADLQINAVISGDSANVFINPGITKSGGGTLYLAGTNTYNGNTVINDGQIAIFADKALGTPLTPLGASAGTIINGTGNLFLSNAQVTNEDLTINSTGGSQALGASGASVWTGDVLLNADTQISSSSSFALSGAITGVGGFTKLSAGSLTLGGTNANTYSGTTTVRDGTLLLDKSVTDGALSGPLVIGEDELPENTDVVRWLRCCQLPDDTDITINASGLLDLNGFGENVGNLTFNGGDLDTAAAGSILPIGNITVSANTNSQAILSGRMSVLSNPVIDVTGHFFSPDLKIDAQLTGGGGFTKNGVGEVSLTASNLYTGTTTVNDGFLIVDHSNALGTTNGGTVVNSGAALALRFDSRVAGETLTLAGPGRPGFGALNSSFGSNSWSGNITLSSNATVFVNTADYLNLSGSISGGFNLTKTGSGTLSYSGTTANTYGSTTVNAGTLALAKTVANVSIPGPLTIGDGSGGINADAVRLDLDNQISDTSAITISSSGRLNMNGNIDTVGAVTGSSVNSRIDLGPSGATLRVGADNGSSTFNGLILGTGSLFKLGLGTWTLTADNPYLGQTTVSAGTLQVEGAQPQSPVTVNGTATLKGGGTVGSVFVFGNLMPGASPGVLTCSNLTFSSSASDYFVELAGPFPGTDYDQMNVRGTNGLAGATLHVTPAFTRPVATGQSLIIINNDGAEAINGIFAGLPEGAGITAGSYGFRITYAGGTGNDVALVVTNVPGTIVNSTVTSGNGSRGIDPNGCNNLALAITNTAGLAMTGINATLSTTTPGVIITQPYSPYPNIPVSSKGTNIAPFQISTLPSFVCGTAINLQLSVDSSLGSFTMNYVLPSGETAAVPNRYDVTGNLAIPDIGTVDSTNVVSGFSGPLQKVVVSLYLTHSFDGDLTNISLISPDGTTVLLSSANGGSGDDYGSAISPDSSRTTFDDASGTPITNGAAPFVGTFRPQGSLAAFNGNGTPNGNWRLRIADGFGGSVGTLRAWSLFLTGTTCATGSGACNYCFPPVTGLIGAGDSSQTSRLFRNGVVASCGLLKPYPGSVSVSLRYDVYAFTNTSPADACVTVLLAAPCDLQAGVYLNAFDPLDISANYLGDSGVSTGTVGGLQSCSVIVPAGAKFLVAVNEVAPSGGCSYTLQLAGLPCPPPVLNIQPVVAEQARLFWDTSAGGFVLQSASNLTGTAWVNVTNEPIVNGGNYNVTNSSGIPTNRFYRLNKP